MPKTKTQQIIWIIILAVFFMTSATFSDADVLDDLRQQMAQKRKAIDEIEQKINEFKSSIAKQQSQAATLSGQIVIIDNGVKTLTLEIDKTNAEISELQTESDALKEQIQMVDVQIENQKEILREYLRTLQSLDTIGSVQAFFKYATLSDAIKEIRSVYRAEQNSQITLDRIRELEQTLKARQATFSDFKRELDGLQSRQISQKNILGQQQDAKKRLLELTRAQEFEFNKMLSKTVAEQKKQDAEISRIDAAIRQELERQDYRKLTGVGQLDWPINPIFGISCGFQCDGYPYASLIGAHTGTDMPIDVGTPIKSAADGYVGKVHISSGSGYSYILIIHGDNISTVYGHVTNASVNEGSYVTRGQVIGHTGGAPGSRGSGLSTGPHLHFEVRKNGIPANAQNFLPSL